MIAANLKVARSLPLAVWLPPTLWLLFVLFMIIVPHIFLHPLLSPNGRRVLETGYVLAVITLIFLAATVFTDPGTVHYGPEEHDLIEHELPVALRLGPSEFADEVPATRTRGCER